MSQIITCAYCGQEYPKDTPAWGNDALTAHIKLCNKHPMRELQTNYDKIRKALVGFIGMDGMDHLNTLESLMLTLPMEEETRISSLNGIRALRDTLPKENS